MRAAALSLRQCEICSFYTCPEPDQCATVLRILRDEDTRRAELGLPPFAESTEEGDAAILDVGVEPEADGEGWCSACATVHSAPCGECGGHVFHRNDCGEVW